MRISITTYNEAENNALGNLSNTAIQEFKPAAFVQYSYPIHIYRHEELLRYVDVMHELSIREVISSYEYNEYRYTDMEATLLNEIIKTVVQLTKREFGKSISPLMSPLFATKLYRFIMNIKNYTKKNLSIFEIGPGSGYLGALLIKSGLCYSSMDNTQALYLWQNLLYDSIASNEVIDFAGIEYDKKYFANQVLHIPWWVYCNLYREYEQIKRDIIICDHALAEIPDRALRYILRVSFKMLQGDGLKLFVFMHRGRKVFRNMKGIYLELKKAGFVPLISTAFSKGQISCFTPKNTDLSQYSCDLEMISNNSIKHKIKRKMKYIFRDSNNELLNILSNIGDIGTLKASEFININSDEYPPDYDFLSFVDLANEFNKEI